MALLAGDVGKPTTSPEKPCVFLDHLASFGKNVSISMAAVVLFSRF